MIDVLPRLAVRRRLRVLCIGAHCDDIEIGCGATLAKLQDRAGGVQVDWAILTGDAMRRRETLAARSLLLRPRARGTMEFGDFADGRLPAKYAAVKEWFERLRAASTPDVVFCHERDDRHQDHRIVNEMVWSSFRNQLVLEYEIPKWDGGLVTPNAYVAVSRVHVRRKVAALLRAYTSQAHRDWFTASTFEALLRLRGIESRAPSGFAEAFHVRKFNIAFG